MTDRHATVWLGVGFLCLYLLTASGHYGGDGFWSYLTAESVLLDGDLIVGDRPFLVREMHSQFTGNGHEGAVVGSGRLYSKYGLGLALLEVPFYGVGLLVSLAGVPVPSDYVRMFAVANTNAFVTAATCLLLFGFARKLGYTRSTQLWVSVIFGIGSMALPYASYGFSEPLVGLALIGSVYGLHAYSTTDKKARLVLAGSLAGYAIVTKASAVVALPLLAVYLHATIRSGPPREQLKRWIALLTPIAVSALIVLWHNWIRYGDAFSTGYHLDDYTHAGGLFNFSPAHIATGIYGLLFSTGRGLFLFFPVAILMPWAIARLRRSHHNEAALFLGVTAAFLLAHACFADWHGGSSWGPRYLLPALPFIVLALGSLLGRGRRSSAVVKTLAVVGLLIQLPVALVNYHLFVRFVDERILPSTVAAVDPIFAPWLSPIVGGYCQLCSALSNAVSGQAVDFPFAPTAAGQISMAGYDLFDLWWLNAFRTGHLSAGWTPAIIAIVTILVGSICISVWKLCSWGANTRDWQPDPLADRADER